MFVSFPYFYNNAAINCLALKKLQITQNVLKI